jgi:hypothetical protein
MKKLLRIPVLLIALLCSAELLTGCVASAQPGVVVAGGPVYYPPPRPYYGYRARPYYHRPARVVVVDRQPVRVHPQRRSGVVRPRSDYYRQNTRQPMRGDTRTGRDRGRIR